MGLPVTVVKADSGAIGGTGSEEFMVQSQAGEDKILFVMPVIIKQMSKRQNLFFLNFLKQKNLCPCRK